MPMTFDTYARCSYNCLYCFAYFQKSHSLHNYLRGDVRCVDPSKVINLFEKAQKNDRAKISKKYLQFFPYIQARRIMQWGGLADEFDEFERRYGITLELLRYFDKIDYPLSFSTKAAWWTEDSRYTSLFARHRYNWHVKISIITDDELKAKRIERGCPSPQDRIAAIRNLTTIGNHVTLRLRPFILGVSGNYKNLIRMAHEAGADSVTTEFFCMESRANDALRKRYDMMSEVCGFDIYSYYMQNSKQSGYKRLNRAIKAPIIHDMRDYAHSLGMRFHVSDAFCRECNDACNCCGVPPEWGVSQYGNIGQAVIIAREKGEVRFSDMSPYINRFFKFNFIEAEGYNTGTNKTRAIYKNATMAQWLRLNWNDVKKATSPGKGYGGILKPVGVDENGDVIYKYGIKGEEADGGTCSETVGAPAE